MIEAEIERPPPEVFAFATDPARLPEWQTNTISVTPLEDGPLPVDGHLRFEPVGAGTRFAFTVQARPPASPASPSPCCAWRLSASSRSTAPS